MEFKRAHVTSSPARSVLGRCETDHTASPHTKCDECVHWEPLRTGLNDGPPNSILRGRCGREFTTLCNLPERHTGQCSWVPQLTDKPSDKYAVYFASEFICKLDDYIDRVKRDWEIVRGIAEPPPLTPEGECKAFEIIVSDKSGFTGISFERETGTQIYKHPLVQAAWEGWQYRSQTSQLTAVEP